jgi:hypothetical protein
MPSRLLPNIINDLKINDAVASHMHNDQAILSHEHHIGIKNQDPDLGLQAHLALRANTA